MQTVEMVAQAVVLVTKVEAEELEQPIKVLMAVQAQQVLAVLQEAVVVLVLLAQMQLVPQVVMVVLV
jgi:hypothetical protein